MSQQMSLERMIAGWMTDEAAGAPADVLEQILDTTRDTRPQPRWWALLREAPLRTATTRTAVGLPNRGLVLAAVLALLLVALAVVAVGTRLLLDQQYAADADDWPGFRGAADRSGFGVSGPTGNPILGWRHQASGAVLEVAIVDDRAYFASDDGSLEAVSREDGTPVWSVSVADPPVLGPYAADDRLYVSDASGRLHAYGQGDGAELWTSTQSYDVPSRLISVDGTLYFGTSDGLIVAIDGGTGAERWRLRPDGATHVDAPAFGEGLLFVGTDGAGFVAIDPATRKVVWTGDTAGEDTGTATVIDGIAYLGAAAEATSGRLRAFDAQGGRLLWTGADDLLQAPAVVEGVAYSPTIHGLVTATDTATGDTRWRRQFDGEVRAPVVAGGIVYLFAGSERRLYAVEATSGDLLWTFDVEATGNCCIAVAHGDVFVGLQDGSVYAIAGDGRPIAARPFPSPVPTATPSSPASPTPASTPTPVAVTWITDLAGRAFAPINQIAIDPAGRIWAPEAESGRIAILDADGTVLEEWGEYGTGPGQFDFSRGNGDGYGTLAFERDGSFYVLDVGNRRIQAFDKDRQFIKGWGGFGTDPGEYTDPIGIAVAPDGTLWVLDDVRGVMEPYDRSGEVLPGAFDPFVNVPATKGANSMAIGPDGHFFVTQVGPNQVAEFDADGTFIRAFGQDDFLVDQPTDLAIDADGRIFVTQGPARGSLSGVTVFAADGTRIGGFEPTGTGQGRMVFPAGIALDGHGSLLVMDGDRGSPRLVKVVLAPPFAS